MHVTKVVLAVLLTAASTGALAQTLFGAGTVTCGKYLELRKENNKEIDHLNVFWIMGYVSAYNVWSHEKAIDHLPDPESVLAYFDRYCRDNPLRQLVDAADKLIRDLGGGKP